MMIGRWYARLLQRYQIRAFFLRRMLLASERKSFEEAQNTEIVTRSQKEMKPEKREANKHKQVGNKGGPEIIKSFFNFTENIL